MERIIRRQWQNYQAVLQENKVNLLKLLNSAEGQNSHSKKIEIFYRNKDSAYFEKVEQNGNVLPVIKKDNGGDRRSPINGSLKGVFLDTTLWGGQLPYKSPFGSERIQFPIAGLFDKTTNLYFTDFYCKKTSYHHYVTLVIAKRGSGPDRFCKENLVRLNPYTNPFLRRCKGNGGEPAFTTIAEDSGDSRLHVEVFYTEEIRINELKRIFGEDRVKRTTIMATGSSTPGGLEKDSSCGSCNPSTSSSYRHPQYVLSAQDDPEEQEWDKTAEEIRQEEIRQAESRKQKAERNQDAITHDIGEKNNPVEGNGELSEIKEIPVAVEEVHVESIGEPAMENDPFEKDKEIEKIPVSTKRIQDDNTQETREENSPVRGSGNLSKVEPIPVPVEELKHDVEELKHDETPELERKSNPVLCTEQLSVENKQTMEVKVPQDNTRISKLEAIENDIDSWKPEDEIKVDQFENLQPETIPLVLTPEDGQFNMIIEPVDVKERPTEDLNCSMTEMERPEILLPEPKPDDIGNERDGQAKEILEPGENKEHSTEDLNCSMAKKEQPEVVLHKPKPEVIVDVQNRKFKEVSEPLEDREHSSKDPSRSKPEVNVDKEKVRDMNGVHESEINNKKRKYEELSSSEEEHPRKKRLID